MKKKIIICITLVIVIALVILLFVKGGSEESTEVEYRDVLVSKMTIENSLSSSGEVYNDNVTKSLNTDRYFEKIYYSSGDYVKKGAKIIKYTNGTYYKAPYNLVLIDYNVPDEDEKVRSNHSITFRRVSSLKMELSIDETDISKVSVNDEVIISLNAFDDKTFTGKIADINQIGSYSSSGTKYTAIVTFKNDGNVKLGMSGSASILVEKAEDVIAVPIEAVQTKGNEKYVLVVNSDGSTSEVIIETGISNDAYVEVKSGLEGSETIRMISTSDSSASAFGNMNRGNGMNMPTGERPSGSNFTPGASRGEVSR